jgi:hypothetical protein
MPAGSLGGLSLDDSTGFTYKHSTLWLLMIGMAILASLMPGLCYHPPQTRATHKPTLHTIVVL